MQGTLFEIDVRSILQLIELGQRTGTLLVEADEPPGDFSVHWESLRPNEEVEISQASQTWYVFFLQGRIVYASQTPASLSRLKDYLRRYQAKAKLTRFMADSVDEQSRSEYEYLWLLLNNHVLTPTQSRNIVHGMVHEVLFDLFSLSCGRFVFVSDSPLAPQLTALTVTPHLTRTIKQVQQWKQLYPYIQSPEQCLAIADTSSLQRLLSQRTFSKFSEFADGTTSIRQIARYLHRDMPTLARAIYPYVQQGVIQLSQPGQRGQKVAASRPAIEPFHSLTPPVTRSPTILCVDPEASIREMVQATLSSHGYVVSAIANAGQTCSQILQLKPKLLLCSTAMPEVNGYELCAMLRQVKAFRQTPIIMLVGKDGLLERMQTRLVGATDYLAKPFGENELLMLVEKYVGLGYAEPPQSINLLADQSDHRLQIDRTDAT